MSHTYFRFNKKQGATSRAIELESEGFKGDLKIRVFDSLKRPGHACITLTEKEQEDLVTGILERRGMLVEFSSIGRIHEYGGFFLREPINGNSIQKQSKVHPANTSKNEVIEGDLLQQQGS